MLPQDTIVFLNTELKTVLDGITVTISRFTKTVDQNPWEIDAHAHLSLELHYIFDGCGTIILYSKDVDTPEKEICSVKNPRQVSDLITACINEQRDQFGIRGKDMVGPGGMPPENPPEE